MLDRDEGSEVPSVSRHVQVSPQYFDGEMLLGAALARQAGVADPMWDVFYFYPPDATWPVGGLPVPTAVIAQLAGVVAGSPGTLPAIPDQSKLPPEFRGKLAVIGAQQDFAAILRRVAQPFAARYRARTPE